jgi:hypothetical protein
MLRAFASILAALLAFALMARPSVAKVTLPKGKGIFIVSIAEWCIAKKYKYSGNDECAKEYAQRIADNDIGWVIIQTYKTNKGRVNSDAAIASLATAILARSPDVQIWLWAWIEPIDKDLEGAASDLVKAALAVNARGVILDVEGGWAKKGRQNQARTLITRLTSEAKAGNLAVGVASYSGIKGSAQIAWDEFSKVDFGLPMIGTKQATKSQESLCSWHDKGFAAIVPVVYFDKTPAASATAWSHHRFPSNAGAWWSWRNLDLAASASKTKAHWDMVQKYTLSDKTFNTSTCKKNP